MDDPRFDALARSLVSAGSRRRALTGLVTSTLGLLGARTEADAAKKKKPCAPCKKRKKGKCKANLPDGTTCENGGSCLSGSCRPTAGPPAPTCTDGIKNGRETDIDCGGSDCVRCAIGRGCVGQADCGSAFCVNNMCQVCTSNEQCGTDSRGECICTQGACVQQTARGRGTVCAQCPPFYTCFIPPVMGDILCLAPCGSA
jgi:hypothetical protein